MYFRPTEGGGCCWSKPQNRWWETCQENSWVYTKRHRTFLRQTSSRNIPWGLWNTIGINVKSDSQPTYPVKELGYSDTRHPITLKDLGAIQHFVSQKGLASQQAHCWLVLINIGWPTAVSCCDFFFLLGVSRYLFVCNFLELSAIFCVSLSISFSGVHIKEAW